ncbi:hypothetical protein OIDMADRAFT_108707, partial [Oidiodendron maius Zn]
WLFDIARQLLQQSKLTGFDISGHNGTFRGFNASNTTFMLHDVLKPFPPDFLGKYDIVHI